MNDLFRLATADIARFLGAHLPSLSPDWWKKHVFDRLSFQQQRIAQERGQKTIQQLDLAALLRVLDQNWYELSGALNLPRDGRNWLKEMQGVRNKWAHMSAEDQPPGELYRDADTLGRLMSMLGADTATIDAIESAKAAAMTAMSRGHQSSGQTAAPVVEPASAVTAPLPTPGPAAPQSLFKVGDLVALKSSPDVLMPILEVVVGGAECRYRVFHNGTKATYYESQLQAPLVKTDDRPLVSAEQLQASLTSLQILSPSTASLFSLRSGRVQFVPYQYRPVLKLIRADRPRLLIADEVGVGKTIETGLIIKELRARMDLSSVLIICPKALVAERKWFLEMKRFDEHFTALDGPALRNCIHETHLDGEWPEQHSKAIIPFSLFDSDLVYGRTIKGKKKERGLIDLDPPPRFDLVIVDEAHHIRNPETYLHQGIRYFCDNAQAVVFLTATPVQLGSEDLFILLNVLRPDLVIDSASFAQMAEPNEFINEAVLHCRKAEPNWPLATRESLDKIAGTEWGRLFMREAPAFQRIYDELGSADLDDSSRVRLIQEISELYTFSSLINRTRRRDIGDFTTRKPETLRVDFTEPQRKLHDDLLDVIAKILAAMHGQQNVKFMMTTIRRQAASCLYGLAPLLEGVLAGKLDALEMMEAGDSDQDMRFDFVDQIRSDIERLVRQAKNLDPKDLKIEGFMKAVSDKSKLPNSKALVFSTFRHTLAYLERHVQQAGLRYGLIHGDVPDDERSTLRQRFSLPKEEPEAIDVLLSSEVGCEGLDFQFCDFLVNYDLPWNPMRIEQRIGRIDRYGQKSESVAIINLVTPGTVDADIYDRCLSRIGVFQRAIGGNEEILGEITAQIHEIEEMLTLTPAEREKRLQQLADNGIRRIQEDERLEAREAELFGLNVPKKSWEQDVEDAESYWLSAAAIEGAVATYMTQRLGTEVEHLLGEKALKTLRLGHEARAMLLADYRKLPSRSNEPVFREWEKWLKGTQPMLPVTFDQAAAAENAKTHHLSVLHPLVRQAARALELHEPAYVSLEVQHKDAPTGRHRFALYRWGTKGVRPDDALVSVADDPKVEGLLLSLLEVASASDAAGPLPTQSSFDELDARHHAKWAVAQGNHAAATREIVGHRIQSLTVSHRARVKVIEDQIAKANNDKIRLMKESELARANMDFDERMKALEVASQQADILAKPVVFGVLEVTRERV